jgi:hypothetical protein
MKKRALLLALFILAFTGTESAPSGMRGVVADCDIDKGPCSKTVGQRTVVLDIEPKPVRVMRELIFRISVRNGGEQREAVIELEMPGMYMGTNRVMLKRESSGEYTGKGIIPRCPSGKRLWRATVTIADTVEVDYLFNVTY